MTDQHPEASLTTPTSSAVPVEPTGAAAHPADGVVVGIDDSASARAAVAWAASAARRRNVGLHLVEVLPGDHAGGADPSTPMVPHGRARALLFRAQGVARAVSPDLPVTMHTLSGPVGAALVSYAAEASLLVVGSNGPGGPIPLSLGSVLGTVTTQCPCPVVLVPATTPSGTAPSSDHAPVLVALDDTPDGERALDFAAEVAHRREVTLIALTSAELPGDDDRPGPGSADDRAASAQVERVRARYPDLDVRPSTISGKPADALLRADTGAQLIVAPSRPRAVGRHGVFGGWTAHFLPVLSTCPVAVVSTHTRASTTLA